MKLIIAIVRPHHLEFVQKALEHENVFVTSLSEVVGSSREPGYTLIYRNREVVVRRPKLRIEVMVEDWQAGEVVDLITASTRVGCPDNVSDAKIMVLQLEERLDARNVKRETNPAHTNRIGALCAT